MENINEEIELSEVFNIIKRNIIYLLIIPLVFAVCGLMITKNFISPLYESRTSILINSNKLEEVTFTQSGVALSKSLIYTYAEIVQSETNINKTIKMLGIEKKDICKLIVTTLKDTQIIEIRARAKNAKLARDIVCTLSENFRNNIKSLAKIDSVEVIDEAKISNEKVSPKTSLNVIISYTLGLMLTVAIIFIRKIFDKKIRTEEDLQKITDIPVLGSVIKFENKKENKLVTELDVNSPISESYRNIRSGIFFANIDKSINKILVTSSSKSVGKSTTICNIAFAMIEMEKKVLLVDCDLRRPSIHKKFRVSNLKGLTNLLLNGDDYKKYIYRINKNLDILVSGKKPNNPAEVIGSNALKEQLDKMSNDYDYVLIDSTPLIVSDSLVLTRVSDGIIYIVKSGEAQSDIVKRNLEKLKLANAKTIGCILNGVNVKEQKYGYYYYDSYYSDIS